MPCCRHFDGEWEPIIAINLERGSLARIVLTLVLATVAVTSAACASSDDSATSAPTSSGATSAPPATTRTVSATSTPTLSSTADQQLAAELETALKENFGLSPTAPFTDLLADPSTTWPGLITAISVQQGRAHVRTDLNKQIDQELGTRAARAIASLVRLGTDQRLKTALSSIFVEDSSGAVISQATV
ncbi:hypothetical protein ACWEKT_20400 [Nocardia takedensis]